MSTKYDVRLGVAKMALRGGRVVALPELTLEQADELGDALKEAALMRWRESRASGEYQALWLERQMAPIRAAKARGETEPRHIARKRPYVEQG